MNEGLNTLSAADVAAVTRNNDGNMWGDGGWFWIIILAFLFCGNGWGNNNGTHDAFVSDEFVKRDIFNTNQNVSNTACETQRDVLENRYTTQLGLQNLQAQMAQCCCDIKESILADGQATRQLIQDNTIQNLRDKLADRDRDLQTAYWQISQVSQTNNIIDAVRPTPKPAYMSCSPYFAYNAFGNGCCASGNVM
jgi:hypothetical protein